MPEFDPPEPEIEKCCGVAALGSIFNYTDFPLTRREIIQKYGEREIEYTTGETMKVKDILNDYPADKFNSLAELEKAFHKKLQED